MRHSRASLHSLNSITKVVKGLADQAKNMRSQKRGLLSSNHKLWDRPKGLNFLANSLPNERITFPRAFCMTRLLLCKTSLSIRRLSQSEHSGIIIIMESKFQPPYISDEVTELYPKNYFLVSRGCHWTKRPAYTNPLAKRGTLNCWESTPHAKGNTTFSSFLLP